MFSGLEAEVTDIKEYLSENELKLTDKKFATLVSAKKWQERRALQQAAMKFMHKVGTAEYDDYNLFLALNQKGEQRTRIKN